MGGGRGGGLNSSPLLSFLVEKVRGSSWREGEGVAGGVVEERTDLEERAR